MALRARVGRHTKDGGRHCQNYPDDQRIVINLLNIVSISDGGSGGGLDNKVVSGVCSHGLYRAISNFEDKHFPGQRSGYVDPGGPMLKRIEDLAVPPALGPIDLVTAVDQYGLPAEPTKGKRVVISKATRVIDSNQVMFVGIVGDSNNAVKAVVVAPPNSVTIEDAGVIDGNRWFRLSRPNANTITIQAKDARGTVVTSFALDGVLLPKVSGSNTPNAIDVTVYSPKDEDDYIDNKMNAIGYSIYLRGFQVYCDDMSMPIEVPNSLVDLNPIKAEPIDTKIYDTLAQAQEAIRLAPAMAKDITPFAYYRGAGGAIIAPTVISAATTPRIIATLWIARAALAKYVQQSLTVVAINIITGRIIRAAFNRLFRAPKDPKPPRGAPPPPPPEPPAMTRLRDTAADLQNKNPVRSAEVLTSPKIYRHGLTADVPASNYATIEKNGALSLSTGADAHYGEGVYAWPAGKPMSRPYVDIEVPAGTGVETIEDGGLRWVRMVPPKGNQLPIKIVGTNLPKAQIEMGRKVVTGAWPDDD
jgi:hypothetical protein